MMSTSIPVQIDQTKDQVLSNFTFTDQFNIIIINRTASRLTRVGAYNNIGTWPINDIGAGTIVFQSIQANTLNTFSFSSNYRLDGGKYFQFVATWPLVEPRKIGIGAINQEGNAPAKAIWDGTKDLKDKTLDNFPFSAWASLQIRGYSKIWLFEVS
jgi:hypothetical protein